MFSKVALSWYGPFPLVGEKKSSFYFRKMLDALAWLARLLLVSAAVFTAVWAMPALEKEETFLIGCMFALTIGIGMAALAVILATLVAVKALLIGPNPEFRIAVAETEEEDEDEDAYKDGLSHPPA
jgi:hypothetical protein